jgi:glycosyltransferase involved in cell wall biosynthesis
VSASRHRILHVFRAPLGGLFRHVLDVAQAQAERGHEVGIFCDSTTGGERAQRVLADLAPMLSLGVTRVPMRRNPNPMDAVALAALARIYRSACPNVLHGHGSKGGAYARLVMSRKLDGETIRAYTPHGGSFNYNPGTVLHRVYMAAEAMLARRTDVFLFESAYVAGRFREFVGGTDRLVRVVVNGIGDNEFDPLVRTPEPFDLVYVGELRAAKGVETLIEAVSLLRARGARLTLLIVGSGPSDDELKQFARDKGVWDSVAFSPPQPIRDALGRGRIMVIPSRAESLPYVILEAAAASQPLVATHVGGIPEIFGPHVGELIAPNDPVVLANAILAKIGETEEVRAAKAKALSDFVRCRFSLGGMIDGVLSGYAAAFDARAAGVGSAALPRAPPLRVWCS